MLKVCKRAHRICDIKLMELIGFCIKDYFTESIKGCFIVIVKCIKIPEIATRCVARDRRFSKQNLRRDFQVVVTVCAPPFEFGKQVQDVCQVVRMSEVSFANSLCK